MQIASLVRAGTDAVTTAEATLGVDLNQSMLVAVGCPAGTNVEARRGIAVLAAMAKIAWFVLGLGRGTG